MRRSLLKFLVALPVVGAILATPSIASAPKIDEAINPPDGVFYSSKLRNRVIGEFSVPSVDRSRWIMSVLRTYKSNNPGIAVTLVIDDSDYYPISGANPTMYVADVVVEVRSDGSKKVLKNRMAIH